MANWTEAQIVAGLADGTLTVPDAYLALDDDELKAKHVSRARDGVMGHGTALWMPQRRTPRRSAPLCPLCRLVFVSAPGEPCEDCWEERRFEQSVLIGRGANDGWPEYLHGASNPSGSRRRPRRPSVKDGGVYS